MLNIVCFQVFKRNESGGERGEKMAIVGQSYDSTRHFQSYLLNDSFAAGSQYFINIHFTSEISVASYRHRGHYLAKYNDSNGIERSASANDYFENFCVP